MYIKIKYYHQKHKRCSIAGKVIGAILGILFVIEKEMKSRKEMSDEEILDKHKFTETRRNLKII
jgi:hypothetical protein